MSPHPHDGAQTPPPVDADRDALRQARQPVRIEALRVEAPALILSPTRFRALTQCLRSCASRGYELTGPVDAVPANRQGIVYGTYSDAPGERRYLRSECDGFNIVPRVLRPTRRDRQGRAASGWLGVLSFGNGLIATDHEGTFVEIKTLLLGQLIAEPAMAQEVLAWTRPLLETAGFTLRRTLTQRDGLTFSASLSEVDAL